MSSPYRTPDPWLMANRQTVTIVAAIMGLIGGALVIGADAKPLQYFGYALIFAALLGWSWMKSRTTPEPGDWLDYLKARAEMDGHGEWLDDVEACFLLHWDIETMEEVSS